MGSGAFARELEADFVDQVADPRGYRVTHKKRQYHAKFIGHPRPIAIMMMDGMLPRGIVFLESLYDIPIGTPVTVDREGRVEPAFDDDDDGIIGRVHDKP